MMLFILKRLGVLTLLILSFSCDKKHDDEVGVKKVLYTLPGLDHGLVQSPVNILTDNTDTDVDHHFAVHYSRDSDRGMVVINTGHTVKLKFRAGTTIDFDGETFDFKQAHFHTPSEHLIDGMTFPMEMHLVNQHPNPEGPPTYLVIAIFFKMGEENAFIKDFIDKIPENAEEENELGEEVTLTDLLGADPEHADLEHFFYRGSLTTPPYTETVNWCIVKRLFEASPEQIVAINKLEGNNARHVQALYGRKVEK